MIDLSIKSFFVFKNKKLLKKGRSKGVFLIMGQKSKGKKWKIENSFFINPKTGKIQYNEKCKKCVCECKQSYLTSVVVCPYFKKREGKIKI